MPGQADTVAPTPTGSHTSRAQCASALVYTLLPPKTLTGEAEQVPRAPTQPLATHHNPQVPRSPAPHLRPRAAVPIEGPSGHPDPQPRSAWEKGSCHCLGWGRWWPGVLLCNTGGPKGQKDLKGQGRPPSLRGWQVTPAMAAPGQDQMPTSPPLPRQNPQWGPSQAPGPEHPHTPLAGEPRGTPVCVACAHQGDS